MPKSGAWAPPEDTVFLSETLILISFISYVAVVKKLNGFLKGKNSIFHNNKVKNFKNLEILQSKRDFFKCLQAITFDTFTLVTSDFLHMFYTGNVTGK